MSSTGSTNHNKRLSSETENSQRALDNDSPRQQQKLRERQRFFEEVFQHDVDVYPSSAHLHVDCRKPPMGSISSMEVNVDILEQMDLMDISDQEALDVFLNSGAEHSPLPSPLPEVDNDDDDDDDEEEEEDESAEVVYKEQVSPCLLSDGCRGSKFRMSSTSSGSSDTSGGAAHTPVIQSDDEEVHADTLLLTSAPQARDEETEEEEEEEEEEEMRGQPILSALFSRQ